MMKLVFVSNYFNHHQKALADEFRRICGDDYMFIAFTPFNEKRLAIGYKDMNQESYVFRAYESPAMMNEARKMIYEAECVIIGGMPVSYVSSRLKQGKITFIQSERFFKGPLWKDIIRYVKYCRYSGGRREARDPSAKFYLLCAGAFAAWDYNICGLFRGKAYRWGYFPELKNVDDIDGLMSRKKPGSILWAGRFLPLKHPDYAVILAKRLRDMNLNFHVKIIGSGEMQEALARMIESENLGSHVELVGAMPTEQVRKEMEESQIFLFTSDRGDGWGAVMNEAMNAGCAVIAGEKVGSVPYLVRDGHNGLIFRDGDIDGLTEKTAGLVCDSVRATMIGRNAYETVTGEWSPREAAERFMKLYEALRENAGAVRLWDNGPGSVAPVV